MAFGPAAGLEIVDTLLTEPTLKTYHLLPSVRGDLLARLERLSEKPAQNSSAPPCYPQCARADAATRPGSTAG